MLFWSIPVLIVLFWLVSMILFWKGKLENRKAPGSVPDDKMKMRKFWMILSSVILGLLVLFVVTVIILLSMAVAYM